MLGDEDERPSELPPAFFGSGGGVAFRSAGAPAVAGLPAAALGVGEAFRLAVTLIAEPIADLDAGSEFGGAVTATKLWHFGHSTICPMTDGS